MSEQLKILFNPLTAKFDYVSVSNGAFQRNLPKNLTLKDGESLVVARYVNANGHTITLEGDSTLLVV